MAKLGAELPEISARPELDPWSTGRAAVNAGREDETAAVGSDVSEVNSGNTREDDRDGDVTCWL
jgi:hypothetical protein